MGRPASSQVAVASMARRAASRSAGPSYSSSRRWGVRPMRTASRAVNGSGRRGACGTTARAWGGGGPGGGGGGGAGGGVGRGGEGPGGCGAVAEGQAADGEGGCRVGPG